MHTGRSLRLKLPPGSTRKKPSNAMPTLGCRHVPLFASLKVSQRSSPSYSGGSHALTSFAHHGYRLATSDCCFGLSNAITQNIPVFGVEPLSNCFVTKYSWFEHSLRRMSAWNDPPNEDIVLDPAHQEECLRGPKCECADAHP